MVSLAAAIIKVAGIGREEVGGKGGRGEKEVRKEEGERREQGGGGGKEGGRKKKKGLLDPSSW